MNTANKPLPPCPPGEAMPGDREAMSAQERKRKQRERDAERSAQQQTSRLTLTGLIEGYSRAMAEEGFTLALAIATELQERARAAAIKRANAEKARSTLDQELDAALSGLKAWKSDCHARY